MHERQSTAPGWLDRLSQARAMYLVADVSRISYEGDDGSIELHQHAEVFMTPNEILLASWIGDRDGDHSGEPHYLLSFRDGTVTEHVRSASSFSYETETYASLHAHGPSDLALLRGDKGCMIGTFAQSWVGPDSPHVAFFKRLHDRGKLRLTTTGALGQGRQKFVRTSSTRTDTFDVEDDTLVRWETLQVHGNSLTSEKVPKVLQTRTYSNVALRSGDDSTLRIRLSKYFPAASSP